MSQKKARYLTTTLPYVNADPHIGFATEVVVADALARYWRLMGHEVFFNTGTDEHGQKIAGKADEKGQSRQEYVDHFAGEFKKLGTALDLSFDRFIRTTDPDHKAAAQAIWRKCLENGDIYKKKYKGLYCVGDEMFLRDSDLVDGRCPNHPNMEPQVVEEENYFFALSKYQDYLQEYLGKPGVIEPEWRRLEALKFVESGLEDFSISRERARLDWGIDVPDDENQVMYVWFDALSNYISTLGWPEDKDGNFKKFWEEGETTQLAGKDQVRFQSIMWQAMLKSAGVKATDRVVYHGFITSGGQKMSKSLGNVISPYDLVTRYGTEATRYLLLRHVHPFEDSDITTGRLDELYTAGLVNGLGNLVARVMKMAETHMEGPIDRPEPSGFDREYLEALDSFNIQTACDFIWRKVGEMDERITTEAPFKLVKTDLEKAKTIIRELVRELYIVGRMLHPIMPQTSTAIKEAVLANKKPENLFTRLDQ
jgi:methionyl-tRNA synthetase